VPLLAVGAEWLLGTYRGIEVLSFLAASAPAIGAYVLLHSWGLRWRAAVLAGFVAASAGTGEAMAWGGYPQLLGLGLLPIFIASIEWFITSRGPLRALAPAGLLLALLATSDLIGAVSVVVGLVYVVARYSFLRVNGAGNSVRNLLLGVGLTALLAVLMAPTYIALAPGVASNEHAKLETPWTVFAAIGSATLDLPNFWFPGLVVALAAPLVLLTKRYRMALASFAILVPVLALFSSLGEQRLAYLVPLGIVIGLGAWWEAVPDRFPSWSRRSVDAGLVAFLAFDVLVGTQVFASHRDYYSVLTPAMVQGFTQLDARTDSTQLIAVSPTRNDWELGWWVEGAARRRTIYAGNPIWLNYADERKRNDTANMIFAPDKGVMESSSSARAVGVAYLFVDKEWNGYSAWIGNRLSLSPNMIAYENQDVMIIATSL